MGDMARSEKRRNRKGGKVDMKIFMLVIALFSILVLAACGSKSLTQEVQVNPTEEAGKFQRTTLRLPSSEPRTLDPHLVTDVGSHAFVGKLFSGLVRLEIALFDNKGDVVAVGEDITDEMIEQLRQGDLSASGVVVPDLATELPEPEFNDDGTVSYTFHIKEGAKFSNGRAILAWDVAYSLDRAADPRTRSSTAELYLGDIVGVMDMQRGRIINRVSKKDEVFVDLPGVEVLDDRTIRITIDSPKEYFLMKLTYPTGAVVDKVQTESPGRWTDRPNSTGPWVIAKKDVGEIVLKPNVHYQGVQPTIKEVKFFLSGGSSFLRYKNNELDLAGVGIGDLDLLAEVRDPNSEIGKQYFETTEMSTSYIGPNMRKAPFDDPLVRRAFALAIDKEAIAHDILQDLVIPAYGILPPGMPGYRSDFEGLQYNPELARELLSQSRYADNMPRVKITTSGGGSAPSVVLQSIVEFWRTNLGIEVEIEQMDFASFLDELQKGTVQMFSLGWIADYPDPEDFLDLKFHSSRSTANNETRYANSEVDTLLEQARIEQDYDKRIAIYQRVEEIIVNDAPWIPLFHSKNAILVKSYVCGYIPTPMGISTLRFVKFCD